MSMTPVELDTFRAQCLASNKALALLVIGAPPHYVFDGRPNAHELWKAQERFNEQRLRFTTSKSAAEVRRLAVDLPRAQLVLERAATGWRDRSGVVHMYGPPTPVICPHGRDLDRELCEQCAADDAATDAL